MTLFKIRLNFIDVLVLSFFVWLLINAAYVLVIILSVGSSAPEFRYNYPLGTTLYESEKDEYHEKILKARSLFRIDPDINEPFFAVDFGDNSYNAQYDHRLKCVIINERLVNDFPIEELAAILGHEFAHAERVEKIGFEDRQHWQVDVRGAELTDPRWVEAYLLRFKDAYPEVIKAKEMVSEMRLRPYYLLFLPTILYIESGGEDFDLRLKHVKEMIK